MPSGKGEVKFGQCMLFGIRSMTFTIGCPSCSGLGYHGFQTTNTCSVCKGTGELILEGERSDYKRCGPCGGNGYNGFVSTNFCSVCHGVGLVKPHRVVSKNAVPSRVSNRDPRKHKLAEKDSTVFIVHGRNRAIRNEIDLFLRDLGVRTRVMEYGANLGRTMPEKFEELAKECGYTVVILTADDVRLDRSSGQEARVPRQNVLLEGGYFWGRLGRRGRIAFLYDRDAEIPSDLSGVAWIPITEDLGRTKLELRKELEAIGIVH